MTAERAKRVSLGIGYFLWILFYVHLQIHKAQSTEHHHNVIFRNDDDNNNIAESAPDVESLGKKSDFYDIKNNDSKLQSLQIHKIKPRKSRDLNRSYRPYNDFPILEPILLTNYIQRNPLNNLFNVGAIGNPSTKFNINPTNMENNHPATQDTGLQIPISSSKEPSLPRIAAKSMDEDSTITVKDHEIPMNVRPNAFFLNDDDFVMNGNTTLQPLAVPYTNTDDTLDRQPLKSSSASDIITSTIIPTAELQLVPTSSLLSSNLNSIVSSSFDSSYTTISTSDIHPSETELYSSSTVGLNTMSDVISPSPISSETSSEINVKTSNVISESTISSSWNSFTSEIVNVSSKYSTLSSSVEVEEITVSHTATFSNETESTTPYVMSREPDDPEPDIITAPPFGSEIKTINVSTEFGLGNNKFSHKGQVLDAEVNSNDKDVLISKLNDSKPSHPSSYRPFEDPIVKDLPPTTTSPPAKPWDYNPNSFSDPVGDDYNIETKNDGPILETCTIGDDSSCDAKLNEVCRKDEGVSNCGCRLGSIRKKNNDICRRGREFSALFTVAKDGNTPLNYGEDFLPDGRLFSRTKNQLEKAITNIFRGSEFRSYVVSTKVNSFVPVNDRLVANTTIIFDSGSIFDLADLMSRLKRALTSSFSNNNNRIGKSSFYTREDAEVNIEDIDECKHSDLNDCDKFAICENTIGSFSCECKKGYKDPDAGSPDNKGRKCGGACSNDYCNSHGECQLVDVNVQSCKCHGSWSGEKCSVDSQVLGIAIGSSVVAFLIIIATLIFLIRWSRRSTQKAAATRTMSASTPSNTFTYMKTPQYHMVRPSLERPPERPPQPPLVSLSQDTNNYSREQPRWPEDPFEPFRAEQNSIYHNVEDNTREDAGHYRVPKTAILSPYKANVFPVSEEDLSQYFGSKYNLTEAAHKHQQ